MRINLVDKTVSFVYTNKRGETSLRRGVVMPNSNTRGPETITIREERVKGFDVTSIAPGTFRIES